MNRLGRVTWGVILKYIAYEKWKEITISYFKEVVNVQKMSQKSDRKPWSWFSFEVTWFLKRWEANFAMILWHF
jgi:hypothetical protein